MENIYIVRISLTFMVAHKILFVFSDRLGIDEMVRRFNATPDVEHMFASTESGASSAARASCPIIAIVYDPSSNSRYVCKSIRDASPNTRIYYLPGQRGEWLMPPWIDEIFPNGQHTIDEFYGAVDEYLEKQRMK